jgi:hypothetical protein
LGDGIFYNTTNCAGLKIVFTDLSRRGYDVKAHRKLVKFGNEARCIWKYTGSATDNNFQPKNEVNDDEEQGQDSIGFADFR